MKRIVIAAAFAAGLSGGFAVTPAVAAKSAKGHTGVEWHKGKFADALALAAREKRPLSIDFYAVWCGPCKEMDKTTYVDPAVAKLGRERFVMVRLDSERGEGIELAKKYQVGSYPTVVFLGPDAKELDRFTGYVGPKEMLGAMNDSLAGRTKVDRLLADLAAKPNDPELLLALGDQYTLTLDAANAAKYVDRVIELDPKNAAGHAEKAYFQRADLARRQKDFRKAAATLEEARDKFTVKDEKGMWRSLGVYYARAAEPEKSLAAFETLIAKYPESGSYNAMAWESSQRKINLEAAERYAKRAAEMAKKEKGKDDPGVLDTLAEVYFAQGRYDDAIALAKHEMKLDPKDEYYKLQLEKYEAAKSKAAIAR